MFDRNLCIRRPLPYIMRFVGCLEKDSGAKGREALTIFLKELSKKTKAISDLVYMCRGVNTLQDVNV